MVLNVLDADTEPDCFRADASSTLLLRSHLTMGGRSGMAAQRAGVADVDQSQGSFASPQRSPIRLEEWLSSGMAGGQRDCRAAANGSRTLNLSWLCFAKTI